MTAHAASDLLRRRLIVHQESTLSADQEEWLQRIALRRSLDLMPTAIADVLVTLGLAERILGGTAKATSAGKLYLRARGLATVSSRRKR